MIDFFANWSSGKLSCNWRKADTTTNSELAREKMWARIHLIPLLQAEEDRDQVRRYWAQQAREKELMGVETKVYNSDRCVAFGRDYMVGRMTELLFTDSSDPHMQSLLLIQLNSTVRTRFKDLFSHP